jgi:hypothetical protein
MKALLLAAAATLSLGAGAVFAQHPPAALVNPQLGQAWTKQKLAEQAARDCAKAAKRPASPGRDAAPR